MNRLTFKKIFIIMILSILLNAQEQIKIIDKFAFQSANGQLINGWEEKSFEGNTQYSVEKEDSNFVLHAIADSAASGLHKKIKIDVKEWQHLSWRWKVIQLPEKGDVHFKETDDYGARVYVVFPKLLKWNTRTISYIWAKKLAKEKKHPNPWLPKHVIMVAVESGPDSLDRWIREKRNVYEDYKNIFKEEPPKAGAIAIMSDSDNTGGKAEAFYDDFVFSKN
jgi:hypothetical protein